MSEKKAFCEECRNDVNYKLIEKEIEGNIKGEKYLFKGKEAHCQQCGSEIYIDDVNDYNLKMLYDEYRKYKGLIPLEKILEIPEKYSIGKRPLSLLLGWGEQTYSRYCDGDIPSKQYSDILQKIYSEPLYYSEILENNKDKLKSNESYEKSKKKLNYILGNNTNSNKKIDLAIEYLLNQCEDITPLALQKALYYIQGFYYAFYKSFLFMDECEAWVHGPVYKEIYNRYRNYQFNPIQCNDQFDESLFSSYEKTIMDSVIKNICCYSGKILEQFTHLEEPWLLTRGDLPDNVSSNRIINRDNIGKYFYNVKEKYNMLTPNDIKVYAKDMFEQI